MMIDIVSSFINLIPVTLAQSLMIGFVVIGIMLPFRILNFPDLTSEGAEHVFTQLQNLIIAIRNIRNEYKIDPRTPISISSPNASKLIPACATISAYSIGGTLAVGRA